MMPRLWHRATGDVVEITADPRGEAGLIRGQKHTERLPAGVAVWSRISATTLRLAHTHTDM